MVERAGVRTGVPCPEPPGRDGSQKGGEGTMAGGKGSRALGQTGAVLGTVGELFGLLWVHKLWWAIPCCCCCSCWQRSCSWPRRRPWLPLCIRSSRLIAELALAADLRHRAGGALEGRAFVDVVLQLFAPDGVAQEQFQFAIGSANPHRVAQIGLVNGEQAGP